MVYKFLLALCLVSVASVSANKESFTHSLSELSTNHHSEYNTLLWMDRMLSETSRGQHLLLPENVHEPELTRGLTVFAHEIFKNPLMHSWNYLSKYDSGSNKKVEWFYIFNLWIVTPCEMTKYLSHESRLLEKSDLSVYEGMWFSVAEICKKILADPEHWKSVTFEVAELNHM